VDFVTVLVFGARGRIAARVIDGLHTAGLPVRAASGRPDAVTVPDGVDVERGDIRQPAVLANALRGVRKVFLYAEPNGIADVVAALRHADVEHVLLLSSSSTASLDGAAESGGPRLTEATDPIAWRHVVVERAVVESGMPFTFLRPGSFAANTLRWAEGIRADGTVRIARPEYQAAPIDERDIAAVAVTALVEPGHEGARYLLSGPESLSQRRQVEIIGAAVGRPLRLVELSDDEARQQIARWGPPALADRLIAALVAGDGKSATTVDTVRRVLDRPARTFEVWARDHADAFR
jgi:uncharacterized protein YbjT (DUF2867 family)